MRKKNIPSKYLNSKYEDELSSTKDKEALNLCNHLIIDYGLRADRAKRNYKRYKYLSIILATAVTILSFVNLAHENGYLIWIIPIVSTIATFSTTLLNTTNAQKDWIRSRTASQKLHMEKFLFILSSGKYSNLDEEERSKEFAGSVANIWNEIHNVWESTRLNS